MNTLVFSLAYPSVLSAAAFAAFFAPHEFVAPRKQWPVPFNELRPFARQALVANRREGRRSRMRLAPDCRELHGMAACHRELAKVMQYLQFGQPCARRRFDIIDVPPIQQSRGVGSSLVDFRAPAQFRALTRHKGVVFSVPNTAWIYQRHNCSERSFECLFRPSSRCRAAEQEQHTLLPRHPPHNHPRQPGERSNVARSQPAAASAHRLRSTNVRAGGLVLAELTF